MLTIPIINDWYLPETNTVDWYYITINALKDVWQGFIGFLPELIAAILIFIIGWFFALGLGKLVSEILKKLKVNSIFERGNLKEILEKSEIKVDFSEFIGAIFKWILVIVSLLIAVEILGFGEFANLLRGVISWLPNLIVAVFIFIIAVVLADILEKIVRAAVGGMEIEYGNLVGAIVKWAIWIFAISAILIQLGVSAELIMTLFTGLVAIIVISGGIAFGLGGKEVAAEILQDLKRKLKK